MKHALTIQREASENRQNLIEMQESAKWLINQRDTQSTVVVKADEHVKSEGVEG